MNKNLELKFNIRYDTIYMKRITEIRVDFEDLLTIAVDID
jgi:hypothetical protein